MPGQVFYVDFSADNSVRMSLAAPGRRPPAPLVCTCLNLDELDKEIGTFLTQHGNPELLGAAWSICGWERDGVFEMPNHSYRIERDWIRQRLNISRVHLVNDIVAAALALDQLEASEMVSIHAGEPDPSQPKALIGIGRSLGTTTVMTDEFGGAVAQPCAGGHCDLAATTEREFAVVRHMIEKFGHVSRVRAVSTRGLVEVYMALQAADGFVKTERSASDIIAAARENDAYARESVAMVLGWLAATAADTTLAVGARGGIYMAGTFFNLIGDLFDEAAFAARFTDKGRLSDMLRDTPVYIVQAAEPEMIGLSTLFR